MKIEKLYLALLLSVPVAWAAEGEEKNISQAGYKPAAVARDWAYKPVNPAAAPNVKQANWVQTPIDSFVLEKLESHGLKPAPDADRATFIRRATLDAWGLLPTPEEVEDFENDRSSDAYEKLVDRLLASSHFGERQARRWLDLARYADSAGFQNDQTRANNWRYRDYVINAFNTDKPFDQFIKEQIAGDELWPDSQEAKIATGFLAGYPDNSNSRDLVQRHYQIATDITDLVGETFLASTIGCARCHNHKVDKITQKEYFELQAYFSNVAFNEKTPILAGTETEWDKTFAEQQATYQAVIKDIRAQQKAVVDQIREIGLKYYKERYLTDSREAIFKPKEQWTALDRWVNHRLTAVVTDNNIAGYLAEASKKGFPDYQVHYVELKAEYDRLAEELKKYDNLKPAGGSANYTTALELGPEPVPVHVRFTGIHERPLEEVQPGLPALWAGENEPAITATANSTGRRSALASWIASSENPLTSRVFVNRVWAQYFDRGIVGTPGDFGRAGNKPTHPELLDYLAQDFVERGWSVKQLHKEILLSRVYRQSSAERGDVLAVDPQNQLLGIYPRKRLEAEEIRDALLYVAGELNPTVGGPAVFPPLPPNLAASGQDFNGGGLWTVSKDPEDHKRRSIYTFVRRSMPYPLTASFDPADPSAPHHKRNVTTTPLQALTLFNSDLVSQWSQALAGRVINEAGNNTDAQLAYLYRVLFSREPNRTEKSTLKAFLKEQEKVIESKAWTDKFEVAVPTGLRDTKQLDPFRAAALVDLVHTVANSNDFAYRF
jgi:hypothetical protein